MTKIKIEVKIYPLNSIPNEKLHFAVICSEHKSMWIWCKNKKRAWELPGGKREIDENILDTAKRELYEETGAVDFELTPICEYSRSKEDIKFGRLFYANIKKLNILPKSEIEKIQLFNEIPQDLTFPEIQPILFKEVIKWKTI